MSGCAPTPLQARWLPLRQAVDDARRKLDAETFEWFVSMLTILVARLNAERVERRMAGGRMSLADLGGHDEVAA